MRTIVQASRSYQSLFILLLRHSGEVTPLGKASREEAHTFLWFGARDILPPAGLEAGWGIALSGWDTPSPGLAWPPGAGPVLGMASDPVSRRGWGSVLRTAVPSCFPDDIVQKAHPLPSSSADQGTQVSGPFWGPYDPG